MPGWRGKCGPGSEELRVMWGLGRTSQLIRWGRAETSQREQAFQAEEVGGEAGGWLGKMEAGGCGLVEEIAAGPQEAHRTSEPIILQP